ncbi:Transcriptional regulator [Malassezia brasiliensis]|uniref:Transcriptional regulator n=1 Tax=Malassezia brasiliensis TaxID=1821822 RepID=A0AAF0DVK6_9BASI|nr:Transcriptional regulator [Malassezia brasiliensis]
MAHGSRDALAALRAAAPTFGRYAAPTSALPSVEELGALHTELAALARDADARLAALLAERGKAPNTAATPIKREDDAAWDARPAAHTYARARRTHARGGSGSGSDSDAAGDAPRAPKRGALGFRLKMHAPDPRRAPEAAPAHAALALDGETFVDDTTFSWEVPADADAVLPQCEPVHLPAPYPVHPLDVHEDFANKDWRERDAPNRDAGRGRQAKETSQVPATTFFNYAESFFKPITEDDLAWLSSKNDDPYPFHFPELGPHYRKVWEKEDHELLGLLHSDGASAWRPPPRADDTGAASAAEPPRALSLHELRDAHLYTRGVRGGALVERLAAALLVPRHACSAAPAPDGAPPPRLTPPPDVHKPLSDIEGEARQECEAIGLLDTNVAAQWQEHADGPIASALRRAQARLRTQMRANEARKARLFRVAQDRMAWQDYQACLAALDREIETAWTKRQRQIKASMGKKRRGAPEDAGPSKPQLPDTLPTTLARRRQLKAAFEPLFDKMPHARGPPHESIYQ